MLSEQIKKDRMIAKKSGDESKYESLTTLLSEVQRLEKPDQEDDVKVQQVVTKSLKGINEMIPLTEDAEKTAVLQAEKIVLSGYLPKQMSEDELKTAISGAIAQTEAQTPKDMGKVMTVLSADYKGLFDGKVVSGLVRSMLE